ncbi:hypothetical protein SAMN05421810_11150 [Amycolatopsis arida]|uniref:Uncharacterized protein n=1 Tax=Amycolatopsis arida TaxID=587909 RepID=A0A1I6A3G7_9PSEU|nr:hypothetical protein [Amycolatopsis arida]TDX88641.1 hypothetical protein CLV69_111163 [Amycolatopsis arida]SFQ63249.1 hypothetical protein SAMN05421810_11150 [Amycolatopsis arida]
MNEPWEPAKGSSVGLTVGLVAIVVAGVALVGAVFGYGVLSLVNGTATALGLGEPVSIRVVAEHGFRRRSSDATGEYVRNGEIHRTGLGGGTEGEVVDAQFAPIEWFGFDEPIISWWEPLLRIGVGVFCVGMVVGGVAWAIRSGRRNRPITPPVGP